MVQLQSKNMVQISQGKVTSQTTLLHVQFVTGILLSSAQQQLLSNITGFGPLFLTKKEKEKKKWTNPTESLSVHCSHFIYTRLALLTRANTTKSNTSCLSLCTTPSICCTLSSSVAWESSRLERRLVSLVISSRNYGPIKIVRQLSTGNDP